MSAPRVRSILTRSLLLTLAGVLLFEAVAELYNVAFGTGLWLGGFSLKWGFAFLLLALLSAAAWGVGAWAAWHPARMHPLSESLARRRTRLGLTRWLIAGVVLLLPVWFLQYSAWGVVLGKPYLRLLIWLLVALVAACLIERDASRLLTWGGLTISFLLSGAAFALALPFGQVTDYPFALGWSEGNRLWDYSLAFGSHLYKFPPADPPAAYLEPGRQLVGALPFLLPNVSIVGERLWLALLDVLPYGLLGLLAFLRSRGRRDGLGILAGIWGFMFLSQGPIHPPLLVCAILVVVAWGGPLWLGIPLLVASGYFASISRFTWIFAPAIWAVLLEFGASCTDGERVQRQTWITAASLGVAGLFGSIILPYLLKLAHFDLGIRSSASGAASGGVSVSTLTTAASAQPLLWYRLFPNATYGSGILIGLLIAAGPLIAMLVYLSVRHWKLNLLQRLAIILPAIAFLAVGLVISTKIGGGGDLHNLDMFLIGLLLAAALAWKALGPGFFQAAVSSDRWIRTLLLISICLPAYQPLMALRPLSFANDESWLMVLTDTARLKDLDSLPSAETTAFELGKLRAQLGAARAHGAVLFMDQRQLLTFGYVSDVQLVPEYEKKQMMDEALSANRAYFDAFYHDLASHRFSLIISDPLRMPIKDSDYGFGEENNAWVKWVTRPVLCYYEEKDTLTNVRVELLVPRQVPIDCAGVLP